MRFASVALLALALALPSAALAQTEADQQAHTHFDSGHLHYERGEYEVALSEFQAAYDLSHRSALLYNLYLTLERLARLSDAADRLEAYLGSDAAIDASQRTDLEARLVNLRRRIAEAAAATPEPTPTPTPTPEPSSDGGLHELGIGGVIALAIGGASLIGFAIAGGLALSEDGRLANTCGRNVGSFCTDSDVSTLRTLDTTADVLLSIGLVAAAAGAVLLIVDLTSAHGPSEHSAHLSPLLSPNLVGLSVGGDL